MVALLLAGCGGGGDAGTDSGTPAQTASGGAGGEATAGGAPGGGAPGGGLASNPTPAQMLPPGAAPMAGMPGGPGMMGGPPGTGGMMPPGMGGMGGGGFGAPAGGQQTASAGPPPKDTTPPASRRADPFAPWWKPQPPPPPPAISLVAPIRIATHSSEPPKEVTIQVQEVPNRRVAGILTGNGVYALIEGPEGAAVVKPGDPLGDYRVESINANSVTLKKKENNRVYTQVVPLTDAGSQAASGGLRPGGGGVPGFMPPGGRFGGARRGFGGGNAGSMEE